MEKEELKQEFDRSKYIAGIDPIVEETLEEGYERVYDSIDYTEFDFTSFKLGAKWMQEQMEKLKDFDVWKEWKNS